MNEKAREVANNLGLAMAQWGKVENEIYLLYCGLCLAGGYPNPCSVIYESLIHLDTKMAVVERLIEFRMTDPAGLAAWTTLDNRLRRQDGVDPRLAGLADDLREFRVIHASRSWP